MGDKLEKPLHQLREAARRVAEICDESEIAMDVEEYVAKVSVYVRFYPIGTPEHIFSSSNLEACVLYSPLLRFSTSPLLRFSMSSPAILSTRYVAKFNPDLMEVVYAWCHGAKFSEICKMTKVFEGSVIRAVRRLEELIRQLASAAKAIGDTDLEAKFTAAAAAIKRDIIFAASLYL